MKPLRPLLAGVALAVALSACTTIVPPIATMTDWVGVLDDMTFGLTASIPQDARTGRTKLVTLQPGMPNELAGLFATSLVKSGMRISAKPGADTPLTARLSVTPVHVRTYGADPVVEVVLTMTVVDKNEVVARLTRVRELDAPMAQLLKPWLSAPVPPPPLPPPSPNRTFPLVNQR